MYAVTYKGKPATLEKLMSLEPALYDPSPYDTFFIVDRTKRGAIREFVSYMGFTWCERPKGVECQKVQVVA